MNVNEAPLVNTLNLSLFIDKLSQALLCDFRHTNPKSIVLDLKACS